MRDIPRADKQQERHAQLLLCMFKPMFEVGDLRLPEDKSWTEALNRTEASNQWDPDSVTMRMNIRAMLTQRLAADDEMARRRAELLAARQGDDSISGDVNGDITGIVCDGDDTTGNNVLPLAKNAHIVSAYVNGALESILAAGFSRCDPLLHIDATDQSSTILLSGRTSDQIAADVSEIRQGDDKSTANKLMLEFAAKLQKSDNTACASDPEEEDPVPNPNSYNTAAMDPYILDLRSKSQSGLDEDVKRTMEFEIQSIYCMTCSESQYI